MRAFVAVAAVLLAVGCLEASPRESQGAPPPGGSAIGTTTTPSSTTTPSTVSNATPNATVPPPETTMPADEAVHGQDSEFGSIRAPYARSIGPDAQAIPAKAVLRTSYAERNASFFLFSVTRERSNATVTLDHLVREDTGAELACYQHTATEQDAKCFVAVRDMPPPGTSIRIVAGARAEENATLGFVVVAFTAQWRMVTMSNGLDAQLYAYTILRP